MGGSDEGFCAVIREFDVLDRTGPGQYALKYPESDTGDRFAGIYSEALNEQYYPMKTIFFGFGYDAVRDSGPRIPMTRNQITGDVIEWMGNPINPDITGSDTPPVRRSFLSQNHPNPLNPSMTILYGLEKKALVSIRIFDVNGRLIRTLVGEVRQAGYHKTRWNGRNDRGSDFASGVYFYRMDTSEFRRTRKMILLR